MVLTPEEVLEFFEVGYLIRDRLFTEPEIKAIQESFDRIHQLSRTMHETQVYQGSQFVYTEGRLDRIVWCSGVAPELQKAGEDPRITKIVSELLDSPRQIDQLICQAHIKSPQDGVEFPWHQDSEHRGYGTEGWVDLNHKGSYVQTLMALDDLTAENGAPSFIPRSGAKGHLALNLCDDPTKLVDFSKAVPLYLPRGSVAFFGPYVVHGSFENRSPGLRRVFINGYAYPGANRRNYPGCGLGHRIDLDVSRESDSPQPRQF